MKICHAAGFMWMLNCTKIDRSRRDLFRFERIFTNRDREIQMDPHQVEVHFEWIFPNRNRNRNSLLIKE